jgi:hypothetical protein
MNTQKDRVYRLKGATAPLSFILNSRHSRRKPLLYFDGKRQRALRYSSNQASPFQDEQDDNSIIMPVVFEDGMLVVPKEDTVLQEFLSYHPGNGSVFEEVDNARDASAEVEQMDWQLEAQIAAKNLDIESLEVVARIALGVNPDNMSAAELKRDVRLYAKNNPEEFLEVINDPLIEIQGLASSLLAQRILTLKNKDRDIYYNLEGNKKKLLTIPFGQEPIPTLVSFFQSDEGIEVMDTLKNLLDD